MADPVERAKALLGLPPAATGVAHAVRRLDRPGEHYTLVHVAGHLVCLDAAGALMSSGASSRDAVAVTRDDALRLAALPADATAELVWQPCAASLSMMDPFWEVRSAAATRYVDQRGRVLQSLQPKRPGG